MTCPRKSKQCKQKMCFDYKNHYICSGKLKRGTKYKNDIIQLCLKGKFINNFCMEMTRSEALLIISALSGSLSDGEKE